MRKVGSGNVPSMLFETQRVRVQLWQPGDEDNIYTIYGDPQVATYVDDGQPIPYEDCARWIEITLKNYESRGYGMLAFISKETGIWIGCGGFVHPGGQQEPELKYAFGSDHWGQGYATEVLTQLVIFGRESWALKSIIATVHPENSASQHVLSKLGFTRGEDRIEDDGEVTQVWELD